MSIERVQRATGAVWRVRWRDEQGRNRSKVLGRKRDAEAFDAEVRRLKRTRELGHLDAGKQTLAEFGEEWWRLHAGPNLAATTRETYAAMWDTHVLPRLGGLSLRALDGERLREFRADLEADGVGPASVRKTLTLLHGVLQRAVEWGRIPSNPASMVRKPAPKRQLAISPLPPAVVERLRAQLLQRGCQRDATLVSVLAYAGLRPGEALALSWRHVGRNALLVDGAVSLGEIGNTKTGRSRTVPLLAPLGQDLSEWHLASGRPGDDALVFPAGDGTPWSRTAWQNWRRRVYAATAKDLGIQTTRPYDLRHSFVSLLIHEGRSIVDIARQAGHAPTMTLATYAHVFDEFEHAYEASRAVHPHALGHAKRTRHGRSRTDAFADHGVAPERGAPAGIAIEPGQQQVDFLRRQFAVQECGQLFFEYLAHMFATVGWSGWVAGHRLDAPIDGITRPEDARAHGADRAVHGAGDFLVAQAVDLAQHDGRAQFLGQ